MLREDTTSILVSRDHTIVHPSFLRAKPRRALLTFINDSLESNASTSFPFYAALDQSLQIIAPRQHPFSTDVIVTPTCNPIRRWKESQGILLF
ncbi:hypothetical protein CEXT_754231 [Caerostris extrusa]|uniref:Uncharacterized protein n=1 Tax=Caerostris extrusa TaxID=172846 RepID=A0AAV4UMB3_CAEEX|nr:hypothetical protein CEXT_754231 [Caerostris extrusa]